MVRVATTVGTAAAAATAALGIILAFVYRPTADASVLGLLHTLATVVLIAAAATAAVGVVLLLVRSDADWAMTQVQSGRAGIVGVALIAAVATQVTRGLVEWEQIAFSSVRAGTQLSGYLLAALDDDIHILLVDGAGMSQGAYRAALAVHLAAPLAAGAALWLTHRALATPTPMPSPTHEPVESI